MESHVHLKSNKAPIYAIKGPETASAKFLKVLFSWATKLEDCNCVLTPNSVIKALKVSMNLSRPAFIVLLKR